MSPTRRVTAKTTARCRTAGDTSQMALEAASSPCSTGRAPADPAASVEAQRYRSAPGWSAANLTAPQSERSKPCSTALASYTERYKPLTIQHVPVCSTYLIGDWEEKNFSWVKCLSLSEEERLLLVLGGLRSRNLLFLEVGEETSFCLWGGKRRILVVALIGKRESLLSVWDRGDSLLSVRKDRIL